MSAWVSFPRLDFFTIFTFSSLFPQYVKEVLCFALAKSIFGCGAERCSRLPWAALGSSRGAGVRFPPEAAAAAAASRSSSGVLTPAANLQFVLFGNRDQVLCYSSTCTRALPIDAELERESGSSLYFKYTRVFPICAELERVHERDLGYSG